MPSAVSAVSLKLPPFWPGDPELWFAQVEVQFALRGITAQTTKFSYVMASLTQEYAHEVRDVLLHPPTDDPFTHLKQQLIARLCASEQKRIRQLLSEEQLGDRTPSQFLRHLQQLQGSTAVESALLQELFMQRLPSQVRMVLVSTPDLPLERQALLADNLMEIASTPVSSSHNSTLQPPPHHQPQTLWLNSVRKCLPYVNSCKRPNAEADHLLPAVVAAQAPVPDTSTKMASAGTTGILATTLVIATHHVTSRETRTPAGSRGASCWSSHP